MPSRFPTVVLATVLVVALGACGTSAGASHSASQAAADGASAPPVDPSQAGASAEPTAPPSDAPPSDDNGGIPDDAELEARYERLLAVLAPPNSTEQAREKPGLLDLGVFYVSTASYEELVAFYDQAIRDAGLEIAGFNEPFPDNVEWDFVAGTDFFGGVSISPAEGAYRVLIALLGIPPAG